MKGFVFVFGFAHLRQTRQEKNSKSFPKRGKTITPVLNSARMVFGKIFKNVQAPWIGFGIERELPF